MKYQEMSRTLPDDLERLARKRAGRRMGWLIHLLVFVSVNLLLVVMSAAGGRLSGFVPLWGWGVGLTIHGAVVFLASGGWGLHDRLVRAERQRLASGLSQR